MKRAATSEKRGMACQQIVIRDRKMAGPDRLGHPPLCLPGPPMRPYRLRPCAVLCAAVFMCSGPAAAQVVISQVYGGGGNTGAPFRHDFIELFNAGTNAVDLSAMSVQYASSTGTTWSRTNLTGTLQPGQYYLIQQAAGSLLADAAYSSAVGKAMVGAIASDLTDRDPFAVLLVQIWHPGGGTLIAQVTEPLRVRRPRAGAGLTTGDDPIQMPWRSRRPSARQGVDRNSPRLRIQ